MPVTNQGQLDMNLSWGVGFASRDVAEVGELPKPTVRAPNARATVHVPVRGDAGISDSSMPVEYAKHRPQGSRRTAGRTPARRTLGETPLARSLPPCARRRGAPRPRSVACPSRSAQPFRPPASLVARGSRLPGGPPVTRSPVPVSGTFLVLLVAPVPLKTPPFVQLRDPVAVLHLAAEHPVLEH